MSPENSYIGKAIIEISKVVNAAIPVAVSLAFLFFFWGLAKYVLKAGDEKARVEGRNRMVQGVIALFVLGSLWGLVNLLGVLLGTNLYVPPDPGLREPIPSNAPSCVYDNILKRDICF